MPSSRLRQPLRHRPRGAVATALRVSALVVALVALVAPVAPGVGADPATAATPGSAAASGVVTSATTAPVGPGGYVGLSPTRLFDSAENPPLDGDTSQWPHLRQLLVTGRAGVPATNVSAVLLNVTVANTQQAGYLTVFPAGSPQPTASNLNWNARGATTADLVLAKVGTGGLVSFVQSGYDADTRLVVDLAGYVVGGPGPTTPGSLVPLAPQRLLDTRIGLGRPGTTPVPAGQTVHLQAGGRGGVPTGAGAVLLTVTVTGPTAAGYVTVHPDGTAPPLASNVNYLAGQTVPNLVLARLSPDGRAAITTSSATHLVADVAGWVPGGTSTASGATTGLAPVRVLDTRDGTGTTAGLVTAGSTVHLRVTGSRDVPTGAAAVVLNVTVTGAGAAGYVTVHPDGTSSPLSSNLNYGRGQTVANLVVARLSPDGSVALTVAGGATHLVADVAGWTAPGWGLDSFVRDDGPWTGTLGGDVLRDPRRYGVPRPPSAVPADAPPYAEYPSWNAADCDAPTGACTAVGSYHASDGFHAMIAVRPAGGPGSAWTTWSVFAQGELTDVRCPGGGHCWATGYSDLGPVTPVVDVDLTAVTATPVTVDVPQRIRGLRIDCSSPLSCVAVGDSYGGQPVQPVWVIALADGAWSATAILVPGSDPAFTPPLSVRCGTGDLCMLYGPARSGGPDGVLLAVRHGHPGTPTVLPAAGTVHRSVSDVVCWSDTACLAVGSSHDTAPGSEILPLTYVGDGDHWTPVPAPLPPGMTGAELERVDCVSSTYCAVAGGTGYRYRSGSFTIVPLVLTGPPSALTGVATPAPVTRVWDVVVDAVQCASSGRCYLLGSVRSSPTSTPFVLHEPAG